jgi:hypothetical protein
MTQMGAAAIWITLAKFLQTAPVIYESLNLTKKGKLQLNRDTYEIGRASEESVTAFRTANKAVVPLAAVAAGATQTRYTLPRHH